MTRIGDHVQSDLGPYLLQFPCRRRLFFGPRWHGRQIAGGEERCLRKDKWVDSGVACAYRAYDVVPSLHDYGRNMTAAYPLSLTR